MKLAVCLAVATSRLGMFPYYHRLHNNNNTSITRTFQEFTQFI